MRAVVRWTDEGSDRDRAGAIGRRPRRVRRPPSTSWSRPASTRCGCRRWCTARWSSRSSGWRTRCPGPTRLKVGTGVSVLPGRHPVLVAKQLASLAGLAPAGCCRCSACGPPAAASGRCSPSAGRRAGGVRRVPGAAAAAADGRTTVSFAGSSSRSRARAWGRARPSRWTSGWAAPPAAALQRVGLLGDGWLGSFITPAEAGRRAAPPSRKPPRRPAARWSPITTGSAWRSRPTASRRRWSPRPGTAAGRRPGQPGRRELAGRAADDRGVRGRGPHQVRDQARRGRGLSLERFLGQFAAEMMPLQT